MKDRELASAIRKTLLRDDLLSSHPVDVLASKGIVTLRGTVQSYRRKARAEELAASFEDCRGVANELEVRPPGPTLDDEVARHVRAALDSHADIAPGSIRATVLNGKVTLSGHATSASERSAAEDVVLSARGVRSVENLILVDPVEAISDAGLAAEIKTELDLTRGLRLADIQVSIASNAVVLTGRTEDLWQKQMAEKVARRFGMLRVQNDILVRG